jgi:DNA-binding LacI/PurR family transcriptional regulator
MVQPQDCDLVRYPHEGMAAKAVELLLKHIDSPSREPEKLFWPPTIVGSGDNAVESTDPIPFWDE